MIATLHPDEIHELVDELPPTLAAVLLDEFSSLREAKELPTSPLGQAFELVDGFKDRPHLQYLSDRLAQAVRDVENGKERRIIVEMPPRSGKSLLATQITPAWILSCHPSWPIVLTSYSGTLATEWGRQIRRWVTENRFGEHLAVQRDAGAASGWQTTEGGALLSRSIREALTGHGAKVLIVDDPHKDFAEAHSEASRAAVWNWFQTVAQTRLQPPSLVIVIMTRWHEDDLVGRLQSEEYGDPSDWEVISLPAIAEKADVLGREPGEPLISPLVDESAEEALARWEKVRRAVGSYAWSALYQQRPSPPTGAIFDTGWWKYWTTDPELADGDKVVLVTAEELRNGKWVDSWDATFKGADTSDFVVGQRWAMVGGDRLLMDQVRDRLSFTETIEKMKAWGPAASPLSRYGDLVHQRLIEDKANGPAIIDTLKREISGIKPIEPRGSKEARARAVTPEIESGNVRLPHPSMPGFDWVTEFVSEFREFPNGAHDDQVDAASQALNFLRGPGIASIAIPGARAGGSALPSAYTQRTVSGSRTGAARTLRPRM